jgi:hypothetical protein
MDDVKDLRFAVEGAGEVLAILVHAGSVESLAIRAPESEKQVPHPAKTAGIRDDTCAATRFHEGCQQSHTRATHRWLGQAIVSMLGRIRLGLGGRFR